MQNTNIFYVIRVRVATPLEEIGRSWSPTYKPSGLDMAYISQTAAYKAMIDPDGDEELVKQHAMNKYKRREELKAKKAVAK